MSLVDSSPCKMPKVLAVTSYQLTGDAASWRAMNVAKGLQDCGFDVTVHQYVRRPPGSVSDPETDVPPGIHLKVFTSSRLGAITKHLQYVANGKFDVVIANNINSALYSILGRLRAPLILDCHGDMVAELDMTRLESPYRSHGRFAARKMLYGLADQITCRISSRISCVSKSMVSYMRNRGFPDEKLVYAPNPVDLEFFMPWRDDAVDDLRKSLGFSPEIMLFGYLGRRHPWQGVEQFIAAARTINAPGLGFLVVGAEQSVTEDHLSFVREVALSKMPHFYSACDVLVLPRPSHRATEVAAPTKFAEYAAMGKPILTTDVGDAAALVREYGCGLVVKDNNPNELIRGFLQMKSLPEDVHRSMGAAARKMAEIEFNVGITKDNFSRCIKEITCAEF